MEVSSVDEIIRSMPWGIIGWYNFIKGANILYIGNREDSIAGFFYYREIDIDCLDINEMLKESAQESPKQYDYIICIACLEQSEDPVKDLKAMGKMLRPEGNLLLGMNNRLGIRYFCGDTDPYTGHVFDGVEGYIQNRRL